jgi:hypothetical protein
LAAAVQQAGLMAAADHLRAGGFFAAPGHHVVCYDGHLHAKFFRTERDNFQALILFHVRSG